MTTKYLLERKCFKNNLPLSFLVPSLHSWTRVLQSALGILNKYKKMITQIFLLVNQRKKIVYRLEIFIKPN